MDFEWSEEQRGLYERTHRFCRERLNRDLDRREREASFPREEWTACGDFGLLGLCVPERWGGMGLDVLTTARLVEAFGRGCEDGGLVFSACAHLFAGVTPILEHGGAELKDRLLPGLATGSLIGANAITEAEAGSDVHALKATAERDGDGYRITGVKSYVTNAPVADVFVVYAKTEPAHGSMGISAFVVEADRPGLSVGAPFDKAGLVTSPVAALYLDGCRVPAACRLGEEGEGAAIFAGSMRWERACLFAAYVGAMERLLDRTLEHAGQRRQFRKPLGRHQAFAHRVAEMKLRLESARLLLYRACWLCDRGADATLEIALAKLAISEGAVETARDAVHLHGGMGVVRDTGVERALRDTIPSTIFSGTSEIQRDLIASRLGL